MASPTGYSRQEQIQGQIAGRTPGTVTATGGGTTGAPTGGGTASYRAGNPNPTYYDASGNQQTTGTAVQRPGALPGTGVAGRVPTPNAQVTGTATQRPPFDYAATQYAAQLQALLNRQTGQDTKRISDTNEITPWGSVEYTGTPGEDYTRWQRLNPILTSALNKYQQTQNLAADSAYRRLFNFGSPQLGGDNTEALEQASFDRANALMQPTIEREQRMLGRQVSQQGFDPGSLGALRASGAMDRRHGFQRNDLALAAMADGRRERDALFGQALAGRQQEHSELASMFGMGNIQQQGYQAPAQGQVAPVNFLGAQQQSEANKLAQQQLALQKSQGDRSFWGGIIGTGAAVGLGLLSDRRAKKDVKKVGNLYEYRYKGESSEAPKRVGVMAQEVEKIAPHAVTTGADGFKRVNYSALIRAV